MPVIPVLFGCGSVVRCLHGTQVAAMTAMAMMAMSVKEPGHRRATCQVVAHTAVSLGDVVVASTQGLLAAITVRAAGDTVWVSALQSILICASALVLQHACLPPWVHLVCVGVGHGFQGIQLAPMGHRDNGHEDQDNSQGVEPLQS
jgi:hypothetical protein